MAREWAETSVRWLMDKRPELAGGRAKSPWLDRLHNSLVRMGWKEVGYVGRDGHTREEYGELMQSLSMVWSKEYHDQMVAFLAAGGYAAEDRAWRTASSKAETVAVADGESIALEMDEMDEIEDSLRPRSQLSPDHELAEIVAEASAMADPRYKVW